MSTVGRKRAGRFADRPPNVSLSTKGEVTYFLYIFPDGRRASIGNSNDRSAAYEKARALNAHFASQHPDIGALIAAPAPRPTAGNPALTSVIPEFQRMVLADRTYSERSRDEIRIKLAQYQREWGTRTVQSLTTADFAQFLNPLTPSPYIKHRALLLDLMQFCGHQGYITLNPVAVTLERREGKPRQVHHTAEGIALIRDKAPEWLRRAIDLAIYSLQRREDLVLLHRSQVDLQANTLTILQRKTRNYRNPVYLEIEMTGQLRDVVASCVASDIPCPYLVHKRPERRKGRDQTHKHPRPHPFAVLPAYVTKAFAEIRDSCGAYADLQPDQRPGFHKLRGYGTHLYELAGFDSAYIMALSGHSTESAYKRYAEDHAQKKPRRVSAGLKSLQ